MCFLPVPSATPTSVNISGVTSSNITVQWGPVDCIHHNGNITGYSVRYGVQGSGSTHTLYISGGATTKVTITDLYFSTKYSIEVAAVNAVGTGIYTIAIFTTTNGMISHSIPKLLVVYI